MQIKKKTKLFDLAKELFSIFNLPTELKLKKLKLDKIKLVDEIYKSIFLDKKKIGQYPRYISLKKQGKPIINEIKDFDHINDTILEVLFN